MPKPLLLLDVDGVLCPFGFQFRGPGGSDLLPPDGYRLANCAEHIYVSEMNAQYLKSLMEDFEVHWCTGWMHAANEVIGPLHDLPELPVVDLNGVNICDPIHWKRTSIESHVKDQPFAFIDDEIHDDSIRWAIARSKSVAPTLFVQTNAHEGLTRLHVDVLKEWAKSVREA